MKHLAMTIREGYVEILDARCIGLLRSVLNYYHYSFLIFYNICNSLFFPFTLFTLK